MPAITNNYFNTYIKDKVKPDFSDKMARALLAPAVTVVGKTIHLLGPEHGNGLAYNINNSQRWIKVATVITSIVLFPIVFAATLIGLVLRGNSTSAKDARGEYERLKSKEELAATNIQRHSRSRLCRNKPLEDHRLSLARPTYRTVNYISFERAAAGNTPVYFAPDTIDGKSVVFKAAEMQCQARLQIMKKVREILSSNNSSSLVVPRAKIALPRVYLSPEKERQLHQWLRLPLSSIRRSSLKHSIKQLDGMLGSQLVLIEEKLNCPDNYSSMKNYALQPRLFDAAVKEMVGLFKHGYLSDLVSHQYNPRNEICGTTVRFDNLALDGQTGKINLIDLEHFSLKKSVAEDVRLNDLIRIFPFHEDIIRQEAKTLGMRIDEPSFSRSLESGSRYYNEGCKNFEEFKVRFAESRLKKETFNPVLRGEIEQCIHDHLKFLSRGGEWKTSVIVNKLCQTFRDMLSINYQCSEKGPDVKALVNKMIELALGLDNEEVRGREGYVPKQQYQCHDLALLRGNLERLVINKINDKSSGKYMVDELIYVFFSFLQEKEIIYRYFPMFDDPDWSAVFH